MLLVGLLATPAAAQQKPPAKPQPPTPTTQKPGLVKPKQPKQYRGFISAGAGALAAGSGLSDRFTFDLNAETGTASVEYDSKTAPLLDVGGGWRFWKKSGVAVAFSRSSVESVAQTNSEIPHPFFDDRDRLVSGEAGNIGRVETAAHLQLFWLREYRRWRTRVLGGVSYFNVRQDVITRINVLETYPYDTAEFRSATRERATGSGPGFNAAVDLGWMFTPQFGWGAAVRFARGSVDLNVSGGRNVSTDAGGVQAVAGVRIAF